MRVYVSWPSWSRRWDARGKPAHDKRDSGCATQTENALGRFRAARRKQIAGAAHRANDRRMRRIRLDLATQARDPYIDRAVEGLAVARIGEVEQLLAATGPVS